MSSSEFRRDWLVRHGRWPVSIPRSKIGTAIAELKKLLNVNWVEKQVQKYRTWRLQNSLEAPQFLFHREPDCNLLTPYFALYEEWLTQGSPHDWPADKARALMDLANLAGSIFSFESFWSTIPNDLGKNHLARSLQKVELCRGMLAELLTVTHFVQAGAPRVIPRFMDPRPCADKSDILATWDNKEIEIHCKSKIPGAGYLVPFDTFDYWGGCFLRDAEYFDRSWYVKLEVSGKIGSHKAKELRQRFPKWLANSLVFERCDIGDNIIAASKEIEVPSDGLTRQKVSQLARKPMYRAFSAWKVGSNGNYYALSVFDMTFNLRPHPVRALSASLKEVKKQATGNRPAIASIHVFDDWNLDDLLSPQASGFQAWLLGSLGDERGRNISAVLLTCEPKHKPMSGMVGVKQYPALWVFNPRAHRALPAGLIPRPK